MDCNDSTQYPCFACGSLHATSVRQSAADLLRVRARRAASLFLLQNRLTHGQGKPYVGRGLFGFRRIEALRPSCEPLERLLEPRTDSSSRNPPPSLQGRSQAAMTSLSHESSVIMTAWHAMHHKTRGPVGPVLSPVRDVSFHAAVQYGTVDVMMTRALLSRVCFACPPQPPTIFVRIAHATCNRDTQGAARATVLSRWCVFFGARYL